MGARDFELWPHSSFGQLDSNKARQAAVPIRFRMTVARNRTANRRHMSTTQYYGSHGRFSERTKTHSVVWFELLRDGEAI
jgi:hypothetical protein